MGKLVLSHKTDRLSCPGTHGFEFISAWPRPGHSSGLRARSSVSFFAGKGWPKLGPLFGSPSERRKKAPGSTKEPAICLTTLLIYHTCLSLGISSLDFWDPFWAKYGDAGCPFQVGSKGKPPFWGVPYFDTSTILDPANRGNGVLYCNHGY